MLANKFAFPKARKTVQSKSFIGFDAARYDTGLTLDEEFPAESLIVPKMLFISF